MIAAKKFWQQHHRRYNITFVEKSCEKFKDDNFPFRIHPSSCNKLTYLSSLGDSFYCNSVCSWHGVVSKQCQNWVIASSRETLGFRLVTRMFQAIK
jgi:hypothetical protein